MKLILAPHITVRVGPRDLPARDLARYPIVDVPGTPDDLLADVIEDAIRANADAVVRAASHLDAPPYTPDWWWLAGITRLGDPVEFLSFGPSHLYAIDAEGRLHFRFLAEIRLADYLRAVDEGHYPTSEHTLIVTRGAEFGGNGPLVPSLLTWILREFPWVLLGVGIDRLAVRRDRKKREDLERLADDWAARRLENPATLRRFVETKDRWYPSVLSQRLALSEAAARRLLEALGYVPGVDDVMELKETAHGRAARDAWAEAEQAESYVTLDELLDEPHDNA